MNGKVVLVTGANSGIGKETCRELAKMGARVVMVCRNEQRGRAAQSELQLDTGRELDLMICDLGSQAEIRQLAADFLAKYDRLDVLLNNAGLIASDRRETVDGLEMTFAVNHLGYFLLTNLLLDRLIESAPARIVNVSSTMHRRGVINFDDLQTENNYNGWGVYASSKLANLHFTRTLAEKLEGTGVTVNALHPGVIGSNLVNEKSSWLLRLGFKVVKPFLGSPAKGARTSIHLASSADVESITGGYFENRREVRPAGRALKGEIAARLWTVSEELTGLSETAA